MKRLTEREKKQLGTIIHYYRLMFYRSDNHYSDAYKQVNFCQGICSQAQLSRLENGDSLVSDMIYYQLLDKLKLQVERIKVVDINTVEKMLDDVMSYQNDDLLIINTKQYTTLIEHLYQQFKSNIIYTHYVYLIEFIVLILEENLEEAASLFELVFSTLDILSPKKLTIALNYIGIYYAKCHKHEEAYKYLMLSMEHMKKHQFDNGIIFIELANSAIYLNRHLTALNYLNVAYHLFASTHNNLLLSRIYTLYSIIYFTCGYYEETRQTIQLTYESLEKTTQTNDALMRDLLCVELALMYKVKEQSVVQIPLNNNYTQVAFEEVSVFKVLIEGNSYQGDHPLYKRVIEFYQTDNKDMIFEKELVYQLTSMPHALAHLVRQEYVQFLKQRKRYKKTLDFIEQTHLIEYNP